MGLLKMAVISVSSLSFIGIVGAATGGGTSPAPTATPQVLPAETVAPTAIPVPATPTPTATPVPTPIPTAVPTPVATKAPTPVPAQPKCDPNYSGCVPIASDVDCAGGSGNGPAYVRGPIAVIGYDKYDLDRDGDGVACQN